MAETEKILIEVEIDNDKAKDDAAQLTGRLEAQRQALKKLKKELADSKGKDKEKAKAVAGLSRSIKDNSDRLRQSTKEVKANDNSINGLRASVSRLTAERNNLDTADAKGLATFKRLTKEIKGQSDQLKELEKDVGDTRRNVGNYAEGIIEASGANALFGGSMGDLKNGFTALKTGLSSLTLGFKGLRGAIAATGIGLLVLALGTLVTFFTKTRKGAQLFEQALGTIKGVVNFLIEGFASMGEAIFDAFSDPKQSLIDLGEAIKTNFINRLKSAFVFVEALSLALDGKFKEALIKVTDAAIQFGTGVENGTEKIVDNTIAVIDWGAALADAGAEGANLVRQNQQLNEVLNQSIIIAKEGELQAEKNRKLRDDENTSLLERIRLNTLAGIGELKRLNAEKEAAKARLQILLNTRKLNKDISDESRREEAELRAELLTIQADYEGRSTEILTEGNNLRKELDQKNADEAKEQAAQEADERQAWLDNRDQQLKDSIAIRQKEESDFTAWEKQNQEEKTKTSQEAADAQISTFTAVSGALGAVSGALEESSVAYKAFAIAQASISAYLAANLALASPPFTPANFLTAGAAIATGLVNVGKIAGFAKGGIVGDGVSINRSNGDNRLITAKTGEAILNKSQQSRIGHGTLARAGVPGFATGGVVGSQLQASSISSSVNSQQDLMNQIKNIPAPVLDYKEFTRFTNTVSLKESRANV